MRKERKEREKELSLLREAIRNNTYMQLYTTGWLPAYYRKRSNEKMITRLDRLPAYYPEMYLDGFKPYEIMAAFRKAMLEEIESRKEEQAENVFNAAAQKTAAK